MSDTQSPLEFASNIELPGGRQTRPGHPISANFGPCQAALRTLRAHFSPEQIRETSIVDIGCFEGTYAVEFAREGFQTTGIEARTSNIEKCNYVRDELGLANLSFAQDDARNLDKYGPFDVTFCSGLLYHLDEPAAYLEALARNTNKLLILQTHYATESLPGEKSLAANLGPLTLHEGNLGRWWPEFPEGVTEAQVEQTPWSAWGNNNSFWIEKRHLLETLRRVGFSLIYEQYDFLTNIVTDPYIESLSRSMFVALKP
jgi:SAM-dependent methyltransferase